MRKEIWDLQVSSGVEESQVQVLVQVRKAKEGMAEKGLEEEIISPSSLMLGGIMHHYDGVAHAHCSFSCHQSNRKPLGCAKGAYYATPLCAIVVPLE